MKCRGDDLTPNTAFFSTLVGDRAFFSRGRGATSGQVTNGMSNCGCAESGGKKKGKKGEKNAKPLPDRSGDDSNGVYIYTARWSNGDDLSVGMHAFA